jgi:hypothetical protein
VTRARIAAHVHSEWSYDGAWPLPELAEAFSRRHYDVVMLSEHNRGFDQERFERYREACAAASTDRILLLPGIEYEDPDNVVHIPVWGEAVPFLGSGRPIYDVLSAADDHDAAAVLAHPWRLGAWKLLEPEWVPLLSAVEIWNRKYDGVAPRAIGLELARKHGLPPFAALDFHNRRHFFPLAMTVELDRPPTIRSIVELLREGRSEPEFLGRSALFFTRGLAGAALHGLEELRLRIGLPLLARTLRRRETGDPIR